MVAASAANAQQIQFAEPVQLNVAGPSAGFDAYGRRFSLTLTDNERVLTRLSAERKQQLKRYRLLRGSLEGQPGSWVRLTESAQGVEGAIWDGHDLYAVTHYSRVAPYLTTPLAAAPDQTVVYRLSDARDLLPQDFCALGPDSVATRKQTALDQYRTLVADLQDSAAQNSDQAPITRQIEIALIADSDFGAGLADDPTAAMLARLNIVEGIFSEQLGLLVLATDIRVMPVDDDPFTSTSATTLLEQLGRYREATAAVRARGLAHLFTGKNLDGTTAGIAYLDSACAGDRGVSLSSQSYGTAVSALIMAHELGHNFGAPHDGEAGGACASTGGGHIMSPVVSGFATFSQCSRTVMQSVLTSARCVTRADFADAALTTDITSRSVDGGVSFELPWVVRAGGTTPVQDVVFTARLPETAGLSIEAISAEDGSCSVSGTTANCSFGVLAPGARRALHLNLHGVSAGIVSVQATVSAANDQLTSNNSRDVTIVIRSGVDAAVTLSASAGEVALGAPLELFADVSSLRALPVRDAVLSLNLNQSVTSASMAGADCVARAYSVTCTLADLPGGQTRRLTVLANTVAAGPLYAAASVNAAGDGDLTNNASVARAWVQTERDLELTAGPAAVELAVGESYEMPLMVRSRGPQATAAVTLLIALPSAGVAVDVVDSEGAPCLRDVDSLRCELGVLPAGATHLVRLRVQGDHASTPLIMATADALDDGYAGNDSAAVQFRIDDPIDLGLLLASGGVGIEDSDFEGSVSLRSDGRETAVGAVLEFQISAAGRLRSAGIYNGAPCELVSPQRARCALPPVSRGIQLQVNYTAQFAEPGSYEVTFTLLTPGDTAASNDTLTRAILVRPYNDIAVSGDLDLTRLMIGDTRKHTFKVKAGPRALDSARFLARHFLPGVRVAAIRASSGNCQLDAETGGSCDFSALAAGSEVEVAVSWHAEDPAEAEVVVGVSTTGDVAMTNNIVRGRAEVMGPTDLELRADPVVNGATGATLDFPKIVIANGAEKAFDTTLQVTLPSGVTLVSISAAHAICSGTAVLQCAFGELDANSLSTVHISVRANHRGSQRATLKLTAMNDINPANDEREMALEITGSTGVAAVQGGGGGGSFEWLTLLLLGWMVLRRCRAGIPAVVPGRHSGITQYSRLRLPTRH